MVKAPRSRDGLAVVHEALVLSGTTSWRTRLCGMGLRSVAARRYAHLILDAWHGPAAWTLAHRLTHRLTLAQSAELHRVARTPEGKLAVAAANIAGDIVESAALPADELDRLIRSIVAAASYIHDRRTRSIPPSDVQLTALANQVKRLAELRDRAPGQQ